ncbi:MAG: T9SS type A sorting domain-containing protein [Bacteroidetes bacterium]|nr:T9SS type A sorting domain-containing protein [Bacteroidota bacterium]
MKKFHLFLFLYLCFISSLTSFAQIDPYPYRGLYIDKFVAWTNNTFPAINETKTLLGRTTEEDSLLNFARDNDFKYLILYDLNKIFAHPNDSLPGASIGGSNRTYKQALCDFIVKAKTQFCIEHIGAAVASTSILSDITDFNSLMITDPYIFNSGSNTFNPSSPNPLSFVQNTYTASDGSMAMRSEMVKTALRISDFNSFCSAKIDVITTEYEFWQQYKNQGCMISDTVFFPDSMTFIYHGTTYNAPFSITLDNNKTISIPNDTIFFGGDTLTPPEPIIFCRTNDQFWAYRQLLIDIKNVQAGSSYPLITDTYLGWFDKDSISDLLQTSIIDSLVNRVGIHIYRTTPSNLWSYMANRDSLFGHNSVLNSIVHPIISSEDPLLGGQNFLGPWLRNQSIGNTLFEAEKALITQYTPNATVYHGNSDPLKFGAFTWFAQSYFKQKIISNNRYYLSNVLWNRPSTICSGQSMFFNYIGPNETGMTMVWNYGDGIQDSIVSPDTTQQNRTHVYTSGGTYIVNCTLYYPAPTDTGIGGCVPYTYRDTVFISGATITATGSTSICQGDSVRLIASSGSSYSWTGGATTQSIYVKTTGTYTVTVLNSNGCAGSSIATINVTVHQKPSNTLSIVSTPCMGGTNGIISATITGGSTPYHYLWSNGTASNPLDTIFAGTYFVTVTDSFGCTDQDTIALTESLTCCGMGLLNAPSNITSLVSGSSYNVNGIVIVSGSVTVSNTRFYMGDYSQIIIGSASTLTMNGCHLSACDSMWNGISFTDNTSLLILNGDTIEDAFHAISDSAGAKITVSNTIFNKNRRAIFIVGSVTALTSTVTNCTFTCQDNGGIVSQTKDGGSAYSGIEMSGMNGWTLNTNHFKHLYYGIKSENSSLVLNTCTFNDMRRYSYTYSNLRAASWTWVNDGYGIYSNNSSGSPISLSVQGNNFTNCGYGVATKNAITIEVTGSTFDSLRYSAVSIVNPTGVDVNIHGNTITHFLNGVSVSEPRVASSTTITGNTFATSSNLNTSPLHNAAVNWSVKLQNRLPGVTTASITNNQMTNQLKGIYLNGCEQVEINSNSIQLIGSTNATRQYGIWLVNSANCTISNDSIITPSGITDPTHARGIRFESSTGCSINSNYFLNLGTGLNGLNFCDLTTLCGNDIWNCVRGLDVFNITLPEQGAVNSPEDNMWRNIALSNRTVGSGAFIKFYHLYAQNDVNNKFSPGINVSLVQSSQNNTGLSPCSVPDTLPQMFTEITDQVIKDSIVFTIYDPENKWFAEKYAFHLLTKDSMLMNQGLLTDIQRQQFFDNLKQRNVGGLEEIHKALEDKDYLQAITKLINFQPENTIEQNLKDVYGVMEKVQSASPLSVDDSLVLDDIAEQLAFEGGPGVFIARAIMDEEYDDELTGSLLRQSNNHNYFSQPDILLYPNPSSGKIVVSKDLSKYGGCTIDVRDMQGRVYLSSKLDINETLFEKDVSFLSSGMYSLQIYCDELLIESLKLVIQK